MQQFSFLKVIVPLVAVLHWAPLQSITSTSTAATLPDDFVDIPVASGFSLATGLAAFPDGRILVVSKAGNVNLITSGGAWSVIHTVPNVLATQEAGLVGVTVDPGWPGRPYIYLYYNRSPLQAIALERYTASGELSDPLSNSMVLGNPYEILSIPETSSNHNGGTLRFGPDGLLYVSVGEDFQFCVAQDSTSLSGVILRMDVSAVPDTGSGPPERSLLIPNDNPYASDTTDAALVFCHGLRNPYRFNCDPQTGLLYVGDVGANDWEELDEVGGGENFGWPIWEADSLFGVNFGIDCGPNPILKFPIASYYHFRDGGGGAKPYVIVAGPSYRLAGGVDDYPIEYDGVVFYAEFYEGWIRALQKVGPDWLPLGPVAGQPDTLNWATGFANITDMIQGPDGSIYYTEFNPARLGKIVHTASTGVPEGTVPAVTLGAVPNPYRVGGQPLRIFSPHGIFTGAVRIYGVQGDLVTTLPPGEPWHGRRDDGEIVAPGTYFLKYDSPAGAWSGKVTIVR